MKNVRELLTPTFSAEDEVPHESLTTVTTTLLAAIAATSGALTLFGVNSDRVWMMLDESTSRNFLFLAALGAIVAVGFALMSYFLAPKSKAWFLGLGVAAYLASLLCAIWAAAVAADAATRPSIVDFSVTNDGTERILTLEVAGSSVDEDDRIGVAVRDVRAEGNDFLLKSYPGTTAGKAVLNAKFAIPTDVEKLEAMVWTFKEGNQPQPACSNTEAAESDEADNEGTMLVDCLHLVIPEALAEPSNPQLPGQ